MGSFYATFPYFFVAGIGTAETAWLPLMPLVGGFVGGRRHALLWTALALSCALFSAGWGAEPLPGKIGEFYEVTNTRLYFGFIACLVIVFTMTVFHVMEGFYERSTERYIDANTSLQDAVADLEIALNERDELRERLVEGQKIESLGLMAGGLAHDFNNLLTGILGELELALLEAPPDSDVAEGISHARESAIAASEMTEALLSYAGKNPVQRTTINPVEVADFVRSLARSITGRSVPIVVDAVVTEATFLGDRAQIQQVLLNLVMNAVQSMSGCDGEVLVTVGERRLDVGDLQQNRALTDLSPGVFVVIEISDRGEGIPPEAMARIFEPFFSSRVKGRGLGLASTLGIVRAHGGGLFVDSTRGVGTTFRVAFARELVDDGVRDREKLVPDLSVGNLLIVDDRVEVLTAVSRMAESLGWDCVAFSSATEALRTFETNPNQVDAALLDVMMPGMNGDALAHELRTIRPELPVIMMSGYVEGPEVLREFEGGRFLKKPFQLEQLQGALALRSSGAEATASDTDLAISRSIV